VRAPVVVVVVVVVESFAAPSSFARVVHRVARAR
jgi:hypothetical protein